MATHIEIDTLIEGIKSLIPEIDPLIPKIDPHIEEIDSLIREIEYLRNRSKFEYNKAFKLAEDNRGKDPRIEAIYQTFWLFSSVKGVEAVDFLQSHINNPYVAARMGWFYTQTGKVDEGMKLLHHAAWKEVQWAEHTLAILYYQGDKVAENEQRAVEMLKTLAAQNFIPSIFSLGIHYYQSPLVEANGKKTGLNLIRQAANAGYQDAISTLYHIEKRAIMFGVAATSY